VHRVTAERLGCTGANAGAGSVWHLLEPRPTPHPQGMGRRTRRVSHQGVWYVTPRIRERLNKHQRGYDRARAIIQLVCPDPHGAADLGLGPDVGAQ